MPRTCKICKQKFEPRFSSVQPVCSPKCAIEYSNKQKKKAWNKEKKVLKEKLKTKQDYLKEVQKLFNQWIRLSKKPICISCSMSLKGKKFDAGHYRTVGNNPELRFEPDNCFPQCVYCNQHRGGNIIEYRKNLIKEIGIDRLKWLEGDHPAKNYSIPELIEMKVKYKDQIKKLK